MEEALTLFSNRSDKRWGFRKCSNLCGRPWLSRSVRGEIAVPPTVLIIEQDKKPLRKMIKSKKFFTFIYNLMSVLYIPSSLHKEAQKTTGNAGSHPQGCVATGLSPVSPRATSVAHPCTFKPSLLRELLLAGQLRPALVSEASEITCDKHRAETSCQLMHPDLSRGALWMMGFNLLCILCLWLCQSFHIFLIQAGQ